MKNWSEMSIPIEKIIIEERFKKELDDITGLTNSINKIGLLNPISVRKVKEGFKLVVGRRRIAACENLGWVKIPARVLAISEYEWWLLQGSLDIANLSVQIAGHFDVVCEICDYPIVEEHHIIPRSIGGTDEDENKINVCPNHHHLLEWMIKILIHLSLDDPKHSKRKQKTHMQMLQKLDLADPKGVLYFEKIIVPKIPDLVDWERPSTSINPSYSALRGIARAIREAGGQAEFIIEEILVRLFP